MKYKLKYFLLLTLIFSLCGCIKTEYSEEKQEEAEVITLSYIPEIVSKVFGNTVGFSPEGNVNIGIVSATNKQEEIWAVVFKCKKYHKTFAIKSKTFYENLKINDVVTLIYKDIRIVDSDLIIGQKTVRILINNKIICKENKNE